MKLELSEKRGYKGGAEELWILASHELEQTREEAEVTEIYVIFVGIGSKNNLLH